MNQFMRKKITPKIIIIFLIIYLANFILPAISYADIETLPETEGIITGYIKEFLADICDIFYSLIHLLIGGTYSKARLGCYTTPTDQDGDQWADAGDNDVYFPFRLRITPETIFSNKISFLTGNFIEPVDASKYIDCEETEHAKGMTKLRNNISSWYIAFRNLALVGLMSVLVYTGIRIVLTSAAKEKAKYKAMLGNWLVAICLLFALHYIMLFTFMLNDKLVEMLDPASNSTLKVQKIGPDTVYFFPNSDEYSDTYIPRYVQWAKSKNLISDSSEMWDSGEKKFTQMANMPQYARVYLQLNGQVGWMYLIIYAALLAYTLLFLVQYMKRAIYLAFLTMIAPLITLTYPIDKMNDGQAQAFNTWLKEFVFNVLLQPFHLIIYSVLVGTAIGMADDNILYVLVSLGFLVPAEKLLRKMFGFDKASTNAFAGAAMGSMAATALSRIASKGGKSGPRSNTKSGSSDSSENRIRGTNNNPYETYENGSDGQASLGTQDNNSEDEERENSNNTGENGNGLNEGAEPPANRRLEGGNDTENSMPDDLPESSSDSPSPSAQQIPNNSNNSGNPSFGRRVGRGMKALGGRAGRAFNRTIGFHPRTLKGKRGGKKLLTGIGNAAEFAGRSMLKASTTAGKYILAGGGAAVAGGAALITGNPSAVAGAAVTAFKSTRKITTNATNAIKQGTSSVATTFGRGYYGNEYNNKLAQKNAKEWRESQQSVDDMRAAFGQEKTSQALDEGRKIVEQSGTVSNDDIVKALNMTKEFGRDKVKDEDAISLETARNLPALAAKTPDSVFENRANYESERNAIQKRLANKGVNEGIARQRAEKCLKDVAKFKGKNIPN